MWAECPPMLPLLSIPSPSSSTIEIGPLSIHFYGLTLLVAIAAAVVITGIRWTRRGGDWDLIFRVAVWGVAFGIVGARLYHVITSWDELPDEWWGPFAIWKGGLGVWGGIGLGCARRRDRGAALRRERREARRLRRARPARRAGHRPVRQLVEPGALRRADRPAVGARDRLRRTGRSSTSTRRRSTRRSSTRRSGASPLQAVLLLIERRFRHPPGRPLRPLRDRLLGRPAAGSRRSASTRPTRSAGSASTSGSRGSPSSWRPPSSSGGSETWKREGGAPPKVETMAIPKGQ